MTKMHRTIRSCPAGDTRLAREWWRACGGALPACRNRLSRLPHYVRREREPLQPGTPAYDVGGPLQTEGKTMKIILVSAAVAGLFALPAFAQEEVTCGDYTLMDNAAQMETIARIEAQTSEMDKQENLTAAAIHEKLTADCKDQVDVLVIDVVKGYMGE